MKIFLTGGGGFLGKHLVKILNDKGYSVTAPSSKDCDLREYDSLNKFWDKFDLIFHLAAYTQAGDWCLKHPGEQWLVNQQINTNLLSWWFNNQKQAKLIAMGTSCSYAPGADLVESAYMGGEPIESLYTYAMTKRMLLQGMRALNSQYDLNYLYIVPSTLYGPGYHADGRQMHFIFDLVRKILKGRDFGETVTLWGDGLQKREIVHVEDFIQNMLNLIAKNETGVFNLGSGIEYKISEFAEMICKLSGYDSRKIEYDTSRYVGAKSKILNINKAKSVLVDYQNRELETGLSELIKWFEFTQSHL